ncbi:PREDICTED: proteoglycan 4-like isoform X2 [Nelumbo nucifera]|uniref:Proteoglycan 4-like isoform X2 n=1 Tax=Nelumbo nucifera TaxID=4432 RepID=A0A1U8BC53_NELNU|nr:PREDICTED: proteoglycan 4-like isoform X2 [Nelumbo nucifera]
MEGGIDVDAPLDYAAFQIFPDQNRYEAFIYADNKVEKLAFGLLEHLIFHLPEVKDFRPRESGDSFKLQLPANLRSSAWFTKSTLSRFLHIVGAPELIKNATAIKDEMLQLEEARRFHISLYSQGKRDLSGNGETDDNSLKDSGLTLRSEVQNTSSDATKNELLRAMDLRLTALREELLAAFNKIAASTCSTKQLSDLALFAQHFGAIDLRNSFFKYIELYQKNQDADSKNEQSTCLQDSGNDSRKMGDGMPQTCSPVHTIKHVKYGVSPAKVAQLERQSSSESEECSNSSDGDQPSKERSRPLIRSASPRRSASPMRRIQIGRSGSRRATALTIKSLSHFPVRERVSSNRNAPGNSSDEEESDQLQKKPDSNVLRMSVKDAISLFESKQRDQDLHPQRRSSADIIISTNKSVLRRWSAGMGDSSTQCLSENASEGVVQVTPNNLIVGENRKNSMDLMTENNLTAEGVDPVKTAEVDSSVEAGNIRSFNSTDNPTDNAVSQAEAASDRLTASAEWSQQKEAELNQLLMQMMETKPVRYRNMATGNSRSQELTEKKGASYDYYKEKRDERLRGQNSGKRTEKDGQIKAMQEVVDQRKSEMISKTAASAGKKDSLGKPRKSEKNSSPPVQQKKETSKPAISRKPSPKASTLPATRKSWPSTPSPKTTKTITSRTPNGMPSNTPSTRRKPQATPSPTQSSPKVERSQQQQRNINGSQTDTKQGLKKSAEKKQQALVKGGRTTKTKVQPDSGDDTGTVPVKPSFYSKVTKKNSSVVPLESKPFLRKGSRVGTGMGQVIKSKASHSDESLKNSGNLIQADEKEVIDGTPEAVTEQNDKDLAPQVSDSANLEGEDSANIHQKCENTETSDQFAPEVDDNLEKTTDLPVKVPADEESAISSIAWVETEDQHEVPLPCESSTPEITVLKSEEPVVLSNPRVRHSLSQMLQEDSGEPEIMEWGNAENPPSMVYQKDAPKGLRRLLKFARKSRGEANVTGWSSPSVFSEGEEDTEEPKTTSKRNADTLLRKATSQAKSFGQHKPSSGESNNSGNFTINDRLLAQSNQSKFAPESSQKLQDGRISAAATSTKATKSFFSLSTFRSSKSNETKFR